MNKATIEAIANEAGGWDHIVGLRCANGTKTYFGRYALSPDDFITFNDNEMMILHHKDSMGNEATSYLMVEEIVQVYTIVDISKPIILRDILD